MGEPVLDDTTPAVASQSEDSISAVDEATKAAPAVATATSPRKAMTSTARPGAPARGGATTTSAVRGTPASRGTSATSARVNAVTSRLTASTSSSAAKANANASSKTAASTVSRPVGANAPSRPSIPMTHARSGSSASSRSGVASPPRKTVPLSSTSGRPPMATNTTRRTTGTGSVRPSITSSVSSSSMANGRKTPSEVAKELAEEQEEIDRLQSRIGELQNSLAESDERLQKAQASATALEAAQAQLDDAAEQHTSQLAAKNAEVQKHLEMIDELRTRIEREKHATASHAADIARLEADSRAHAAERDSQMEVYEKEKAVSAMAELEGQSAALQQTVDAQRLEAENAKVEMERLQTEAARHEESSKASQSEFASLHKELDVLKLNKEEGSKVAAEMAQLRAEAVAAKQKQESSDAELAELRLKLSDTSAIDDATAQAVQLQDDIGRLKMELKRSVEQVDLVQADKEGAMKEAFRRGHAEASAEAARLAERQQVSSQTDIKLALDNLRGELEKQAAVEKASVIEHHRLQQETTEKKSEVARADLEDARASLASQQAQHIEAVKQLQLTHEAALSAAREGTNNDVSAAHEASIADLQKRHQAILTQMEGERADERRLAESKYHDLQTGTSSNMQALQNELAVLRQDHLSSQARILQLQSELDHVQIEAARLASALEDAQKPRGPVADARLPELQSALAQAQAEVKDVTAAMHSTQSNFADLTDSIQLEHKTELERREAMHSKVQQTMQQQINDLQADLLAARQNAVPSSPSRATVANDLDQSLTQLHRAHTAKLNEVENQHSQMLSRMQAERDTLKSERDKLRSEMALRG